MGITLLPKKNRGHIKNKIPVTQSEEKNAKTVVQTEQKTEHAAPVKTFTQDEVNAI